MASSRRRKASSNRVSAGASSDHEAAAFEDRLVHDLTNGVRRGLGLREGVAVPAEVERTVTSAARELAGTAVTTALVREVTRVSRSAPGAAQPEVVAAPSDAAMLAEAQRLAAKRKALCIVGFSREEAMRLLVAEVAAMASAPQR